jgi:IstB-like ATP binding protein
MSILESVRAIAAAMIDRIVHRAEVLSLKRDSYRLDDRDLGRVPAATTTKQHRSGVHFQPTKKGPDQPTLTGFGKD